MSHQGLACADRFAPVSADAPPDTTPWRVADDTFLSAQQVVLATLTSIAAAVAFLLLA